MTALQDLLAKVDIGRLIRFHDAEAGYLSRNGSYTRALRHTETAAILRALIAQEGEA